MKKFKLLIVGWLLYLIFCSLVSFGQTQLELPYSIKVLNPKPLDAYYYNTSFTPYTNTAQVISQISAAVRYRGLLVNVSGVEYWFKDGTADNDLIIKTVDVPVTSVFSRIGNVVAQNGDYNTLQITENTNLYFTQARARNALSFSTGSGAYNSSTGVFSIPTNTNELVNSAGFITASSSNTLTNKSGNISQWTNDAGYLTSVTGAWLSASGTTLTGANIITGTTTNTLKFNFNSLGTTQTNGVGLWLQNSTSAALNAQQISPSIVWEGQGWKTQSTSASQSVKFASYVLPNQSLSSPSGTWKLDHSINGGAYTNDLSYNSVTGFAVNGSATFVGGTLTINGSGINFGFGPTIFSSGNMTINSPDLTLGDSFGNITINGGILNLTGTTNNSSFIWDDGVVNSGILAFGSFAQGLSITSFDSPGITGNSVIFNMESGQAFFTDTKSIPEGIVYSGTGYVTDIHSLADKEYVDAHSGVASVFSRSGAVTAQSGDYTTAQVTEITNLYFTNARARSSLGFTTGSGAYNSTTGIFTIPTNTNELTNGAGYITASSTNTLTNKSGNISQWTNNAGYLTSFTESDPVFGASAAGSIGTGTGFLFNNGSNTWSFNNNVATNSSTTTFTNKSGNISQWTNDVGYFVASSEWTGVFKECDCESTTATPDWNDACTQSFTYHGFTIYLANTSDDYFLWVGGSGTHTLQWIEDQSKKIDATIDPYAYTLVTTSISTPYKLVNITSGGGSTTGSGSLRIDNYVLNLVYVTNTSGHETGTDYHGFWHITN